MRRKGREREVILIEHLLCALDATGHIPILYLVLQQPAREYVEETSEKSLAVKSHHGYVDRKSVV